MQNNEPMIKCSRCKHWIAMHEWKMQHRRGLFGGSKRQIMHAGCKGQPQHIEPLVSMAIALRPERERQAASKHET